jgi:hypothetical protein
MDAAGKELMSDDDAVGRDARLTFTAPAAGTYYAEVRGLTAHAGSDYFYRLLITNPPPPDFSLTVTPDNPTAPAGAAAAITVAAQRAGYNGEINLRLEGLPAGTTAGPAAIRAGQNSVTFTLAAPPGAPPAAARLRIIGTAPIGDQTVERVAEGRETYQIPGANLQQLPLRATEMVVAAVGPPPPYTLTATLPAAELKAGQKLELAVRVERKAEFKDTVAVTLAGLPPGVTASALTINRDKEEGKITLTAAANAPPGPVSLIVQGKGKNVVVAAPALALTLLPAK